MANTKFDSKSFNPEAFGAYVKRIPNVTKSELAKSGAVGSNEQAKSALGNQTGSLYARIPYFGRISGKTSQNNDGATDITSTNTTTYEQGFVVASRSWSISFLLRIVGRLRSRFILGISSSSQFSLRMRLYIKRKAP